MINEFIHQDKLIETNLNMIDGRYEVTVDGKVYQITEVGPGKYRVFHDGRYMVVACVVRGEKSYLDFDGLLIELSVPQEDSPTASDAAGGIGEKDKVYAPMPGKVVKILVKDGQTVTEKMPLVIVEAMKMEHQIVSMANGKVKKINFKDGEQVDTETAIIELEIDTAE